MNDTILADNCLQELLRQWQEQDEGALLMYALSFLDVKTLLQKEIVSKTWRKLCKQTIKNKCSPNGPKPFQSNQELREAVKKYCKYDAVSMEEIACTYGYPINNWDVSHIDDMSKVFLGMDTFNECIGSWDVSNVTDMGLMFCNATSFNQDIGSWNVSNVTTMDFMFMDASAFNQDIGSWDLANVTDVDGFFWS
jgi:surface protein